MPIFCIEHRLTVTHCDYVECADESEAVALLTDCGTSYESHVASSCLALAASLTVPEATDELYFVGVDPIEETPDGDAPLSVSKFRERFAR